MTTDISKTVMVEASPLKLIGLIGGSLGFVVIGVLLTLDLPIWAGVKIASSMRVLAGYSAIVFFGLCGIGLIWRLLRNTGPVLVLSPEGIRDVRVAAETVPWTAISDVFVWQYSGTKIVVLKVDPAFERQLTLTRMARLTRNANAKLGADGLCITPTGLKMNFDTLFKLISAYRR